MNSARITYAAPSDGTSEGDITALADIYEFVLTAAHRRENASEGSTSEDAQSGAGSDPHAGGARRPAG